MRNKCGQQILSDMHPDTFP